MAGKDERDGQEFSLEDILAEFATNHVPAKPAEAPVSEGQGGEGEKAPEKPAEGQVGEGEKAPQEPEKPEKPEKEVLETEKKDPEGAEKELHKAEKGPEKPAEVKENPGKRPTKPVKSGLHKEEWEENTIPFPVKPEGKEWKEDTIPFPVRPDPTEKPSAPRKKPGVVTDFPGARQDKPEKGPGARTQERNGKRPEAKKPEPEMEKPGPEAAPAQDEDPDATKVLEFPPQEPEGPSPLAQWLNKLRRKTDEFAGHMYEEEGVEDDEQVRKAEKLIPGVDTEETPAKERKPKRVKEKPAPDLPPDQLAKRYGRGLKSLQLRRNLVFLVFLLGFYLTLAEHLPLPIPTPLAINAAWRCYGLAAIQGAAMLLGADVVLRGLIRLFQGRAGMDSLIAASNLAVLADALTIPGLSGEGMLARQGYCMVAALGVFFVMVGEYQKRRGQRLACKTAASASEPYLVTRDEGKWNGRDTYAKWSGPVTGFGSQMQGPDGAERIFRLVVPVLMAACLVFSVIASLGRARPQDLIWCLAATLTAAASFSATICFGRPWQKLCVRLFRSGAALAGWEGVTNTTGASNLLLYDADLFPPGTVKFNGIKVFGDFSTEKVVSYTATVVRDTGSGLDKVFRDLLRAQGGIYRKGEELTTHEGGGASEVIREELVLVGSAAFMELMDVSLPTGLNVKNAVFCAIDGELAGIFALSYHLAPAVAPSLDTLIHNRITPVLCTRDFNIIPSMLRSRFKLPVDKMEFPAIDRRRELSDPKQEHDPTLAAVLCREGIAPYAEAVVGGKRLRTAVRLSAALACVGSAVGATLAFYLTFVAAYGSLTPTNLLMFLLMWLVPTPLITGWVDRY